MSSKEAPEEIKRALVELALLCSKHRYHLDMVSAGRVRDLETTLASVLRARDIQLDLIEQQRGLISKYHAEAYGLRQRVGELETMLDLAGGKRYLLWHAESESLFEETDLRVVARSLDQGCDDVTGNPKFEKRFKEEKEDDM